MSAVAASISDNLMRSVDLADLNGDVAADGKPNCKALVVLRKFPGFTVAVGETPMRNRSMAEAIVGILIPQLVTHVQQLIVYLMAVREIKKHNNLIVEEITNFADTLQTNLRLVKSKLPEKVSGKALDSLLTELKKGNEHMKECLDKGKFKQYWSSKETKSSLESLRQKLMTSFQMAFLITSLDVALDGHRNNQNFQEEMLLISKDRRANSAQIRDLLRPLVAGQNQQMKRQDRHMQTVNHNMEEIRAVLNEISAGQADSVTEKFWNDVVAAISQSASDTPGESSVDKEGTDKYTDDLDSLRTEITQLKESSSIAEKEATGKISFLAAELESEKTKNAAISAKLKKELASALNQASSGGNFQDEAENVRRPVAEGWTDACSNRFLHLSARRNTQHKRKPRGIRTSQENSQAKLESMAYLRNSPPIAAVRISKAISKEQNSVCRQQPQAQDNHKPANDRQRRSAEAQRERRS
ncbi:hypothetical protein R1flu_009104 [Riccia fluitans]|uniref:Uncharacterized protein n=1 Tax=Riccia fluitans TaxID=41844 RepID=A0ABD1Z148_9MARC